MFCFSAPSVGTSGAQLEGKEEGQTHFSVSVYRGGAATRCKISAPPPVGLKRRPVAARTSILVLHDPPASGRGHRRASASFQTVRAGETGGLPTRRPGGV